MFFLWLFQEQAADGETAAAGGPDNAGPAGKAQTVEAVAADGPIADKARAAKSAFEPTEEWVYKEKGGVVDGLFASSTHLIAKMDSLLPHAV